MRIVRVATLAVAACSLRGNVARASGHLLGPLDSPAAIAIVATGAVVPSETGALIEGGTHFVLGWSWQAPFTPSFGHRIVGGVNWVPGGDATGGAAAQGTGSGRATSSRGWASPSITAGRPGPPRSGSGSIPTAMETSNSIRRSTSS